MAFSLFQRTKLSNGPQKRLSFNPLNDVLTAWVFTCIYLTGGVCEVGNMNHALISRNPKAGQNGNCVGFRGKFRFCAQWMAAAVGSPYAFLLAAFTILVWGITGPIFHYSDTWQLVINTATTIVTFLMVFLIQNTQNRDTKALHLKLDELLRGVGGARTSLVNLENLSDEELDHLQKEFERIKERAVHMKNQRHSQPEIQISAEKNNSKSTDA